MITLKKKIMLRRLVCVPRQIIAWYYMKCLHIWRGDELFEITSNSSETSQPLRDPRQRTFVMPNRFCN